MKDVSLAFGKKKEIDDLSQATIVAIDKVKGRVSLSMKNGLVSMATYLHDINDLRVGMTVLVGKINDSYFILEKVTASAKSSNGMTLVQPTADFSQSFEFSVYISANNLQCKLPAYNMVNCFINWGDGSIVRIAEQAVNITHTYSHAGTYIIQIAGYFLWHHWIETVDIAEQFRELRNWGDFPLGSDGGEFHLFEHMTIPATDIPKFPESTFTLSAFSGCMALANIPGIENWIIPNNCTGLYYTFGWSSFNQNISKWNTSHMTTMYGVFYSSQFNQDISGWDISKVTDMTNMFANSAFSTENYEKLLVGWSAQNVQSNVPFGVGGNAQYHAAYAPYKQILVNKGWIITDGGQI